MLTFWFSSDLSIMRGTVWLYFTEDCRSLFLDKLLSLCEGREGYVMFNNVTMKEDAIRFMAGLDREAKFS